MDEFAERRARDDEINLTHVADILDRLLDAVMSGYEDLRFHHAGHDFEFIDILHKVFTGTPGSIGGQSQPTRQFPF
jgi:hypothetical protein